ncbi:hypothetical protein HF086_007000 [Spodoptera exigua]|uniref:Uncharacterized protein n=1 Tax=Spodoptera exigua TaxID=7107 RepID=A0A922MJ03_SPOEX|nr:hypothetical protein HF086_007000 [Spodoptera exigua]
MDIKIPITICLFMFIGTVHGLTCEEYLELPTEDNLSISDLQSMQPEDVVQCLLQLGKERLPLPEAEFIWKSIIKYYDGIGNIPDEVLGVLHWVTIAITPEDYSNMTLSNIDVIQNFGLNYNLNEDQLSALATRVLEDFASKDPEDYTFYDLTAIRQILCAFNKSIIERIHPSSYREASIMIGKLENCNAEAMSGFATLAVQKLAFGSPENWGQNVIKLIGKVADYLPKELNVKINLQPTKTTAGSTDLQ